MQISVVGDAKTLITDAIAAGGFRRVEYRHGRAKLPENGFRTFALRNHPVKMSITRNPKSAGKMIFANPAQLSMVVIRSM